MSKEHTFEKDTIDMDLLRRIMLSMVDELAFDLRKEGKLTACVTVKIRYSNFDTHTMQAKLPFTASERVISKKVLQLFDKLYSRRMLIRLIGVKFSQLITGAYQADLFDDTLQDMSLSQAMDKIRMRYGHQSIKRGFSI